MKSKMVLIFDTETTGLTLHPNVDVSKQPKLIEFGGILLDAAFGSVEEEFSILVNPGEPLSEEITKITGLTDEDLKDASTFGALVPTFHRIFSSATTVVAHNLPFDKTIMWGEYKRWGIADFTWPPHELCTVGLFRDEWGRDAKLTELYLHFMGKPLAQTHRALDDVKALVEIFKAASLAEIVE